MRPTDVTAQLIAKAINSLVDGVLITDAKKRIIAVNESICTMTGYTRDELIGNTCAMLQGPNTQPELVAAMREAVANDETFVGELRNYRKDGTPYWNGLSIAPVYIDGVATHYVSMQRDITAFVAQRKRIENENVTTSMMLSVARGLSGSSEGRDVTQTIADAVPTVCGSDRSVVVFWDDARERFVVASESGWDGEMAERISRWEGTRDDSPDLARVMDSGQPGLMMRSTSEWARSLIDRMGVEALAAAPIAVAGRFLGLVVGLWAETPPPLTLDDTLVDRLMGLAGLAGVALDQNRLREAIAWSARHDPVTGLPNRRMLEAHVGAELDDLAHSGGDDVIVLTCDIDRFKRITDAYSASVVDSVLREMATRLLDALGEDGFVARTGGNSFAVVLRGYVDNLEFTLDRMQEVFAVPFIIEGDTVYAGVSAGLAVSAEMADLEASEGITPAHRLVSLAEDDLRRRRDSRVLDSVVDGEEARLDTDMRSAVANGEITVHYQPQVDLNDGTLLGVEALVRWQHPTLGYISPVRFIPLAEYNGIIREIGWHVLETACRDAARWAEAGHPIEISVNVAVLQLEDPLFADAVVQMTRRSGLDPSRLTLEVTESRVVSDRSVAQAQLRELCAAGFCISVDDFGTGFSSLTQLSNMPVGELKIDRSFVDSITGDGRQMVAGIVGFGRGLELRIVAEGVEDAEQLEALRMLGCDRAQGYYISRPLPVDEFERTWLR